MDPTVSGSAQFKPMFRVHCIEREKRGEEEGRRKGKERKDGRERETDIERKYNKYT